MGVCYAATAACRQQRMQLCSKSISRRLVLPAGVAMLLLLWPGVAIAAICRRRCNTALATTKGVRRRRRATMSMGDGKAGCRAYGLRRRATMGAASAGAGGAYGRVCCGLAGVDDERRRRASTAAASMSRAAAAHASRRRAARALAAAGGDGRLRRCRCKRWCVDEMSAANACRGGRAGRVGDVGGGARAYGAGNAMRTSVGGGGVGAALRMRTAQRRVRRRMARRRACARCAALQCW